MLSRPFVKSAGLVDLVNKAVDIAEMYCTTEQIIHIYWKQQKWSAHVAHIQSVLALMLGKFIIKRNHFQDK